MPSTELVRRGCGNGPEWAYSFAQSDQCVVRGQDWSVGVYQRENHIKDIGGFCALNTHPSVCPSVHRLVSPLSVLLSLYPVSCIMLVRALLQTSLVLWLAQQTLQGGVKPQPVSWGRVMPARGVGVGVKPGGALAALGGQYGSKAMKTGVGHYPGAHLGVGGYRSLGLGGRAGLKHGGYGNHQGANGASLGTGMPLGTGLTNGQGLGMGQGGKRAYGAGVGTHPGYGAVAGNGYPGPRPGIGLGYPTGQRAKEQKPGYNGGAGNYLGASLGPGGYGAALGHGAYPAGAAGKLGANAALGQGGYPQSVAGKSNGYGEGATGYLGAAAGNGYGYGNGYSDGYGAGLGYPADLTDGARNKAGRNEGVNPGGYAGQVQGAYGAPLGAELESNGGKYGGGAAQVPYGNAPVIPSGPEGEGGYPYSAQQLSLNAEGAKSANKYAGAGYGPQQTGYGAQMGATQDALGEQAGKYGGVNGALGNGYKG
ncbi:glycine-rich cell wall structural protein isoform X2 [Xiphias gladius]|uniref:glycine-rich cell wall structural protein isoform X2 n=1 Tax=Xiphias gladius TaxID=8245 RepID=UPI001A980FBF|nr:glycine-rich cell wall structural protein isoform X2 [Xiphias gladius]